MSLSDDTVEDVGAVPCCWSCGSERVVKDAWACWNPDSGMWELEQVFDDEHCRQCEDATRIVWTRAEHPPHKRIRELNDGFRMRAEGQGSVVVTVGLQDKGAAFVTTTLQAVKSFSDFNDDSDPWGEHDFGAVEIEGEQVFWKIDYLCPDLSAGSENPANAGLTHRVLTIMLASEY